MDKKISNDNEHLKRQDKPDFHRAKGDQEGLTGKEKKESAGRKMKAPEEPQNRQPKKASANDRLL